MIVLGEGQYLPTSNNGWTGASTSGVQMVSPYTQGGLYYTTGGNIPTDATAQNYSAPTTTNTPVNDPIVQAQAEAARVAAEEAAQRELQANTINSIYDSRIGRLTNVLGGLDGQRDKALSAYDQNYALGQQQLNSSIATGRENLGYQDTQNLNQKTRSYRDIAQGIRNTMESGANRLGAMNAIDSSASPMLQYALANMQARQQGQANENFGDNQTQIGLARSNMEREFEMQLNSLQAEKRSKIQEIADQFSQVKQQIADQIASSDEARATELANLGRQYTMQALASIQDLESQYNARSDSWVQNALKSMPTINTQPFQQTAQLNDYGTYGRGASLGGQAPNYQDTLAASPLRKLRETV